MPQGHAMVEAASILPSLARFATRLQLEGVPDPVRREARWCLLDTIGCILAGTQYEDPSALLAAEDSTADRGTASVFGHDVRVAPESAARVNGYLGDILELNDLMGGHASIACVPATLAMAEHLQSDGRRLLEAIIVAIEVTVRVYTAFYRHLKPYGDVGMNPSGIPSTIGSAAGVAKLIGLSEAQTLHAMSIGGSLAGWCPAEVIFGQGGTVKPMLFGGWPASVGIRAARYAAAGLTGPARLLESPIGYYVTVATRHDAAAAVDPADWYLVRPSRKLHACCSYNHSAIETLAALHRSGAIPSEDVAIVIGVAPYVEEGIAKSGPPASAHEARFHAPFLLALAASGIDVIRPEHCESYADYLDDPRTASLMRRITLRADPECRHYYQCTVAIQDAGGRTIARQRGLAPKGSPDNPFDQAGIRQKFRQLTGSATADASQDRYMDRIERIEDESNLSWIFATAR